MKPVLPKKKRNTRILKKRVVSFYVATIAGALGVVFCVASFTFFVIQERNITIRSIDEEPQSTATIVQVSEVEFPVGVDPRNKEIEENENVEQYFKEYVSVGKSASDSHTSWSTRLFGKLARIHWYQNLASLSSRVLVIESGERKEQVAENFGEILKWNNEQKAEFLTLIEGSAPELKDGKFFPGTYSVSRGATPGEVSKLILDRFTNEVLTRYPEEVSLVVPLNDALTIASLLEREAYGFEDMRHISGVIWNRLFVDMRLQIDATLQYAKGSDPDEPWWPKVVPDDKYLTSAYNTYKIEGLPPTPIANPSLAAILAALNPTKTECMYYFHDRKSEFHCSVTYEEHVKSLKQYYGQGK